MKIVVTGGSGFIGRFLVESLKKIGHEVLIIDREITTESDCGELEKIDILDAERLSFVFSRFRPEIVYHLAAKADVFGHSLEDYRVNFEGTENVITACRAAGSVKHFYFTSTQLVNKPGIEDFDGAIYEPLDELYSRSKVIAEQFLRDRVKDIPWTIFRPTNIWGPRHPRFPTQIWRYISKGWYMHPSGQIIRSYGYVENIVEQMVAAMSVDSGLVVGKTFYVGDAPLDSVDWVDAFSCALHGKPAKKFPRWVLKTVAQFGEVLKKMGLPSPIYMDRYNSMTSNYIVCMQPTFDVLGKGSVSLQDGVKRTVKYLKAEHGYE